MTINGCDLKDGFTENYHSFQLTGGHTNTTWTHRILDYFDRLGRLLGYHVQFELNRFDLTWWDYSKDEEGEIFVHVEHENSTNKERIISETLENKVLNSKAKIALAIIYPSNLNDFEEITKWIKNKVQKRMKAEEVVILLDGCCFGDEPYKFIIYNILRKDIILFRYEKTTVKDYHCLEYIKEEKTK